MKSHSAVITALLGSLLLSVAPPGRAAECQGISSLKLPGATITLAQTVAPGAFKLPPGVSGAIVIYPYAKLPAFCRVAGTVKPSSDSNIQFEFWMPVSGWNGKLLGEGNGGFAGDIPYMLLSPAVANGYAVVASDTGHTGGDAGWALGHPEKVIDFGYRAVHETTVLAKTILRAFYSAPLRYSYFCSCSNGGRQALMEAQRYPEDYDGILAGAPANYWSHLMSGFAWDVQALNTPGSYIPSAKLKAIEGAALAVCDARDGLADGIIDDPRKCHFDPSVLLCKGLESDACLSEPQVAALRRIYAGPKNAGGGVFPGYLPGGETGLLGWSNWITGTGPGKGEQARFATQYFANMVTGNPSWDVNSFDPDGDVKAADEKTAAMLNATDPNLKAFQSRGGKLILYHGWSDAAIAPENTINYYQNVVAAMGHNQADGFVRLFMVPGMQHCFLGPGPNSFGQLAPATPADPRHDISLALEQWVEKGIAPDSIVATKFKSDFNPAAGVARTRPLCAYPMVARWSGKGSSDDAANFTCATEPAPPNSR
jgi:feruloyl esterase